MLPQIRIDEIETSRMKNLFWDGMEKSATVFISQVFPKSCCSTKTFSVKLLAHSPKPGF